MRLSGCILAPMRSCALARPEHVLNRQAKRHCGSDICPISSIYDISTGGPSGKSTLRARSGHRHVALGSFYRTGELSSNGGGGHRPRSARASRVSEKDDLPAAHIRPFGFWRSASRAVSMPQPRKHHRIHVFLVRALQGRRGWPGQAGHELQVTPGVPISSESGPTDGAWDRPTPRVRAATSGFSRRRRQATGPSAARYGQLS